MNDPFDTRIRSFVVELLDDPPAPPPFPQPGTVVVRGHHALDTNTRAGARNTTRRWSRGPLVAAAVFTGIVLIGAMVGVLAYLGDGAEPQPAAPPHLQGAAGVIGLTFDSVDGPGTEPDRIVFNADGSFAVIDEFVPQRQSNTVDSGIYTTDGDEITFESDAAANEPTSDVRWFNDPFLFVNNNACEGVVGSYTVTWQTSTRLVLDVISDACPRRLSSANGLELELLLDEQ